jgi:N6-L-threonylcarbamoyladenine synthase
VAGVTRILGLETSCDETAAAVVLDGRRVASNVVASQHELHQTYGGVVPELASRAHLEQIGPILHAAVERAGVSLGDIDAIAVGNRPGLIGSLLVGVSAAKALAWALGKPLVGVDHIQAHLYAAALHEGDHDPAPPQYPALGLVISGGHTSLYHVLSPVQMTLLGRTIDDAIGEAYDKAAVILDAGYPGGPKLDQLAQGGRAGAVEPLPRSMLGRESLDFSFSGLKTALLYRVRGLPQGRGDQATFTRTAADLSGQERADLAAAFQQAAVQAVITKLKRGLEAVDARCVIIGGGVSANSLLRREAKALGDKLDIPVLIPPLSLCVDNAAMIAGLAHHLIHAGLVDDLTLPAIATTKV